MEYTFDDLANSPYFWKEKALDLLMASKILRQAEESYEMEIDGEKVKVPFLRSYWPKIMIRAFALECLIKALWLKNGNILYQGEKYVGIDGMKLHHLSKMFEAVGIILSDEKRNLLDRLSAVSVADGRYPFPSKKNLFDKFNRGKNGEFRVKWSLPQDDSLFTEIQEHLMSKLQYKPEIMEMFRNA